MDTALFLTKKEADWSQTVEEMASERYDMEDNICQFAFVSPPLTVIATEFA